MGDFPAFLGDPDLDREPDREPDPWRPYDEPYIRPGEPENRVRRSLDPQTPLDRLVRKWALVAVVWMGLAAIAGLAPSEWKYGVIACLILFVVGYLRLPR